MPQATVHDHIKKEPFVPYSLCWPSVSVLVAMSLACTRLQSNAGQYNPDAQAGALKAHDMPPPGQEISTITWRSPKMSEIEKEWSEMVPLTGSPMREIRRSELIRKRLSRNDMRKLAGSCDDLPLNADDWTQFQVFVVGQTIEVFEEAPDREGLVTLLSRRCPTSVGTQALEFSLAFYGRKLRDPILVLGEAYAKCRIKKVQQTIATITRQAFKGLEVTGKDDDEFMRNAMRCYRDQKDDLSVNEEYWGNGGWYPSLAGKPETRFLFHRQEKGARGRQ